MSRDYSRDQEQINKIVSTVWALFGVENRLKTIDCWTVRCFFYWCAHKSRDRLQFTSAVVESEMAAERPDKKANKQQAIELDPPVELVFRGGHYITH